MEKVPLVLLVLRVFICKIRRNSLCLVSSCSLSFSPCYRVFSLREDELRLFLLSPGSGLCGTWWFLSKGLDYSDIVNSDVVSYK